MEQASNYHASITLLTTLKLCVLPTHFILFRMTVTTKDDYFPTALAVWSV